MRYKVGPPAGSIEKAPGDFYFCGMYEAMKLQLWVGHSDYKLTISACHLVLMLIMHWEFSGTVRVN